MRIAFHLDQICVRGTTVAVYDYAHYNEKLLNNTSLIFVPHDKFKNSDTRVIPKFLCRFKVVFYDDLEAELAREKCDVLYIIKYGKNDGILPKKIKTVIHCVFDMSEPHGNVYAGVSESLAKKYNSLVYVPHMITPLGDHKFSLRNALKIPPSGVVFGRYGGEDTFNLPFAWRAINQALSEREDIYFMFSNTPIPFSHPRVFLIDKIISPEDKLAFINTCNAHLECGTLGHSFGLAIGEFSSNNKPVIAYNNRKELWNTAHLDILKDKGIYYSDENEFKNILVNFKVEDKDWNAYKDYTPEKVMNIFEKVFLK